MVDKLVDQCIAAMYVLGSTGEGAYADLAVLPDGSELCLYEGEQKIVCAKFNLPWVEQ